MTSGELKRRHHVPKSLHVADVLLLVRTSNSKALASEVRILLQEVGKLRDERRALQYEIAQLMALKSQHGPGGESH